MAQLTDRIRIERPVEVVFDFIADSRIEPTYNPNTFMRRWAHRRRQTRAGVAG